jgi:hypothetical protein
MVIVQILSLLRSRKKNPKGYFLVEAEICDAELGELQCIGINYFRIDIFGRNFSVEVLPNNFSEYFTCILFCPRNQSSIPKPLPLGLRILRLILFREHGGISTLDSVRTGPGLFISGFNKKWRDFLSVLLSNHVVDNYQHL